MDNRKRAKNKYIYMGIAIALFAVVFCAKNKVYAGNAKELDPEHKEVLVLQSYNLDYIHSSEMGDGIKKEFEKSGEQVGLHYEFLDTKNYMSPEYFLLHYREYKEKYKGRIFDAIILCDNDALDFYELFGKGLWPDVEAVVATGINSVSDYPKGLDGLCIIEERFEYKKNIELALEQNKEKDIKRLFFIYDDSKTGDVIRNDLEILTENQYQDFEVYHYYDKTPEQLKEIFDSSTSQDIFFFVLYFNSEDGRTFSHEEVPRFLFGNTKNPIYGFIDFYLNEGIIGGYLIESEVYGRKAVDEVLKMWEGKEVPPIIYEDGSNAKLILDNDIIQKYHITDIPKEAHIINGPQNFIEKNRQIILFFLAIITVLIIMILLLIRVIMATSKVQSKNSEINKLNLHLLEMQKDIVLTLGEVIETRSNETANHVKRVAQISRVLGEGCGLSEEEICNLVMISPMHDIGKIGIPEYILNKPAKLTKDEFQIVKRHSQIGYEILKNSDNEIFSLAALTSLQHHERYDGIGYPVGLKGDEIHIFAKITSVADVYDALRSERIYKKAWSVEDAEAYIIEQRGKAFDPIIVDVFIEKREAIREIFQELS